MLTRPILLPIATVVATVFVSAASVGAITVTSTADAGAGSLRQALADASDGDTIDFALTTAPPITLTSGELVVAKSVTIAGTGVDQLTIDANGASRVFHVSPFTTVTIADLAIIRGNSIGLIDELRGGGCVWSENANVTLSRVRVSECMARYGGGILNDGEAAAAYMRIVESTIADNQTEAGGAGIYNDGSTDSGNATLGVERSTISGNRAPNNSGAGIYNDAFSSGSAVLYVVGSTISNNTAAENGGAILNGGLNLGQAGLSISNSTLAGNAAIAGGAIYNDATGDGLAELTIGDAIIQAGASGGTLANNLGTLVSAGFNLASDGAGGDGSTGPGGLLDAATDRRNTDPLLGALQDNGGPTQTHALLTGSPAIDQGRSDAIPNLDPAADQRGYPRSVDDAAIANASGGDGSDIGAFEVQPPHDLAITSLKVPARVTLRGGTGAANGTVIVQIQNRSASAEVIEDLSALAALVDLEAESLGLGCVAPLATLISGKPNKAPRTIEPTKKMKVAFTVSFDCANDPLPSSKKSPGHDDFRWTASVHRDALDGVSDPHTEDDTCPRPALPDGIDARPDLPLPIKDRGCGGKLPDKTRGADVTTDVVVK